MISLAVVVGLALTSGSAYRAPVAVASGPGPPCAYGVVTNVTPPTITPTGNVANGTTLSVSSSGGWSSCGEPLTGYEYQWMHDDAATPIPGQPVTTSPTTYSVTQSSDVASTMRVAVSGCNADGCSAPVASSNYAALGSNPTKAVHVPCFDTVYSDSERTQIAAKLASAHVRQVRLFVNWPQVETASGVYSSTALARLNTCVNDITSANTTPKMRVLIDVYQTPGWAQSGYTADTRLPPSDCLSSSASCNSIKGVMSELTSYLLGQGYSANQFAFEIWNEPNNRYYWAPVCNNSGTWSRCPDGDSRQVPNAHHQYYYLLNAAYGAVKATTGGGPSVAVTTGGALASWSAYISIPNWTTDLYQDACGTLTSDCRNTSPAPPWDVVALHLYPNEDQYACQTVSAAFQDASTVSNTMGTYGDASLPIWLTEQAWAGPDVPGYCNATDQGARLTEALTYQDIPNKVREVDWWLSDRKHYVQYPNCQIPWVCGTAVLKWDSTLNDFVGETIYSYLSSAPQ